MRWTPEYVLDGADQVYCRTTAAARHEYRKARYLADCGVARQWKTEDEQLRVDFVGVGGELCVRKCLDLPERWDDRDTEGRHDLTYQGKRIDVKATTNAVPWLIVRKTALPVDAYVLVNYHGGRFRICGWQTERMVKRDENTWKWEYAWQKGFYVRYGGDTIQLGLPFNVEAEEIDLLVNALGDSIAELD